MFLSFSKNFFFNTIIQNRENKSVLWTQSVIKELSMSVNTNHETNLLSSIKDYIIVEYKFLL